MFNKGPLHILFYVSALKIVTEKNQQDETAPAFLRHCTGEGWEEKPRVWGGPGTCAIPHSEVLL